jgi:hypothetical protein
VKVYRNIPQTVNAGGTVGCLLVLGRVLKHEEPEEIKRLENGLGDKVRVES